MENCCTCLKNPTTLACGICAEPVCKSCARFLEPDAFAFLPVRPDYLGHDAYCPGCFETKIADDLEAYEAAVDKAGDINVYLKDQSKETRFIPRLQKPIKILNCGDRQELIMRLAFQAVQGGYNAVVDVDLIPSKVNQGGRHRRVEWRGSGVPANVSPRQIPQDKSIWHKPN